MTLKKILKNIRCKIFFCVGSKCSYNEKGKGKLTEVSMIKIDLSEIDETNILTNNNESKIIKSSKNTAYV